MTIGYVGKNCTGCSACASVCPCEAISMQHDAEGFLCPTIDKRKCINCAKCSKVCPCLDSSKPVSVFAVYAARSKDENTLKESSSGGIFKELAIQIFNEDGIVFGASWKDGLDVVHSSANTFEQLAPLQGSKYVQSDIGSSFRDCKVALVSGRKVLFTGTPCQIHGLRLFLGAEYDNLYLVQTICYAVPSPKAWKRYILSRQSELGIDIRQANFRDKITGWPNFSYSLNNGAVVEGGYDTTYARAFFNHLSTRTSCEHCPSRQFKSGADMTIGDFWGIEDFSPRFCDGKGVSCVIVNSIHGAELFEKVKERLDWQVSDFDSVVRRNPGINNDIAHNPKRESFMADIIDNDFSKTVDRYLRPPFWIRARQLMGSLARRLHLR